MLSAPDKRQLDRALPAERLHLVHGLMATSGKTTREGIGRRIEVPAVAHRDVKPWRYPPILDFQ